MRGPAFKPSTTPAVACCLLLGWTPPGAAQTEPPGRYQGSCTASGCHQELLSRPVVHLPIEQGSCGSCHAPKEGTPHEFKLTESGAALCTQCHDADEFEGPVVHPPVAAGQCTACHDPHGAKGKGLLAFESLAESCADCHEETTKDLQHVHGPVAAGQCTACHSPHVSTHPKLLLKPGRDLCFECHEDVRERFGHGKRVHQPAESGCTACHRPHGADNAVLLTAAVPSLCADCHEEIAESAAAKVSHSPMKSERSCSACHDPHASAGQGLLTRNSASELCMECHKKEIKSSSRMIAGLGPELSKPNLHGPVIDGHCGACHNPHGGEMPRLLTASYPSSFYAPYSEDQYTLCFECHEAAAFEAADTDDATEFRNGGQNLHYIHVNKAAKGRTCLVCHETHASKSPHHLREAVGFGAWKLPINYQATTTGGTCQSGCHRPYRYDRDNPVTNLPPTAGHATAPAASASPK